MFTERSPHGAWKQLRAEAARVPCLSHERERALIGQAQSGDRAALGELVQSHMRLVVEAAGRYGRAGLQPHDLISEGCIGLIEAVQRFDLAQPSRLSVYAKWWIRARIREYAFDNRNLVRLPSTRRGRITRAGLATAERALAQQLSRAPTRAELADALGVSENDVAYVSCALSACDVSLTPEAASRRFEPRDQQPSPELLLSERELQHSVAVRVRSAVATLEARDQRIIHEHFLLEDEVSLAELGKTLGVSRQRVSQIVSRVRRRLQKELRAVAS